MSQNIADIRREYSLKTLDESEVKSNPEIQFDVWWAEAQASNIIDVNAMALATIDNNGNPHARIVLLKEYDEKGFVFFTNYESAKGQQLKTNPSASLLFYWKELERQVRISGTVEKILKEESDEYFNSRPQGSKIGAWSSPQSSVIENRNVIENNVEFYSQKFTENVPRPDNWGGFRLLPKNFEFWQGRNSRLHDRIYYTKSLENAWIITRLAP